MGLIYKILHLGRDKFYNSSAQQNKNLNYNTVLEFANKLHKGQFRKDHKTPYIEHPKAVAEIIKEFVILYGRQEDIDLLPELAAAALLHDTIEDTNVCPRDMENRFGVLVSGLVQDVTTVNYDRNEKGKDRYLAEKMTHMTDYALILKLCDRMANVRDSEQLSLGEKFKLRRGTEYILKYVEDMRGHMFNDIQSHLVDALWDDLALHIPYTIFVGTKFEKAVFKDISYVTPDFVRWHEDYIEDYKKSLN